MTVRTWLFGTRTRISFDQGQSWSKWVRSRPVWYLWLKAQLFPRWRTVNKKRFWLLNLLTLLLMMLSFVAGHDVALTDLAMDMHFGRTSLRDNRLVMEIKHRRILR